jgi:hypothetical protein
MQIVLWIIALVFSSRVASPSAAPTSGGFPIATINSVVGDDSFVQAFGRTPDRNDAATVRITTHLSYVEQLLRARDTTALSLSQRWRRTYALEILARYRSRGQFPEGESTHGHLPTFIDRHGVRCAVGYLIEQTHSAALPIALDARFHHAYVAQIDDPEVAAWARATGFTSEELAMIQPSYPPRVADVALTLASEYRGEVARDQPFTGRAHVGMLRGHLQWNGAHNRWWGTPVLAVDGGVGGGSIDGWAHDLHLQVGSQVKFHYGHGRIIIGGTVGLGSDGLGSRVAQAWTIPLNGYYRREFTRHAWLGLHGGPTFAVQARATGWIGGVDVALRDVLRHEDRAGAWSPRDLMFAVDVQRLADTTYVGLTLGIGARPRHGYWAM